MLEQRVAEWPFAVVYMVGKAKGEEHARAAAFVFDTPDGFAFVEPGYLDPFDAGHRFHRIACTLDESEADSGVIGFRGALWQGRLERYDPESAEHVRAVGLALTEFEAYLAERHKGATLDEERAELRAGPLALDLA